MLLMLAVMFTVLGLGATGGQAPGTTRRAAHSAQVTIHAPLAQVFPLFTPEGEKRWAQGWQFEPVHPASGEADQDMVFRTGNDIWILVRYDRTAHGYTYVHTSADLLARIDVDCRAAAPSETVVAVTYSLTAISDKGQAEVDAFSASAYTAKMAHWEKAINAAVAPPHARQ